MKREIAALVALVLILFTFGIGLALHSFLEGNPNAPLLFSVVAPALIGFFWFLYDFRLGSGATAFEEGALRQAIAGSIVIEYVVMVGVFAFWQVNAPLPEVTRTLLTNFTTIVGVVVAFYFGSSAYLEAKKRSEPKSDTPEKKNEASAQQTVTTDVPQAARR